MRTGQIVIVDFAGDEAIAVVRVIDAHRRGLPGVLARDEAIFHVVDRHLRAAEGVCNEGLVADTIVSVIERVAGDGLDDLSNLPDRISAQEIGVVPAVISIDHSSVIVIMPFRALNIVAERIIPNLSELILDWIVPREDGAEVA